MSTLLSCMSHFYLQAKVLSTLNTGNSPGLFFFLNKTGFLLQWPISLISLPLATTTASGKLRHQSWFPAAKLGASHCSSSTLPARQRSHSVPLNVFLPSRVTALNNHTLTMLKTPEAFCYCHSNLNNNSKILVLSKQLHLHISLPSVKQLLTISSPFYLLLKYPENLACAVGVFMSFPPLSLWQKSGFL